MTKRALILSGLSNNASMARGVYAALARGYEDISLLIPGNVDNHSEFLRLTQGKLRGEDQELYAAGLLDDVAGKIKQVGFRSVDEVLEQMQDLATRAQIGDTLFLYLTGHASDYNFRLDGLHEIEILTAESFGMSLMDRNIGALIVITSHCKGETFLRESGVEGERTAAIASLGKSDVLAGSPFNPFLLREAMKGVTLRNAFDYAAEKTSAINHTTPYISMGAALPLDQRL